MATRLSLLLGGQWIAKTHEPLYSVTAFKITVPRASFIKGAIEPSKDNPRVFDLKGGSKVSESAGSLFDSGGGDMLSIDISKIDAYLVTPIPYINPFASRDHLVETLPSQRHLKITYNGVELASSSKWIALFEGSTTPGSKPYPTRYYIPVKHVKMDGLVNTDLHSHCPYKGDASYYTINSTKPPGENLVWYYPTPIEHCKNIEETVCFYLEKPGFELSVEGGPIEPPTEGFPFDE